MARLSRQFYDGDTVEIARRLLGKYVVRVLDGELLVETPIVTGNLARGHGTPTGVFSVRNKQTSTYLIGKDYRSYVNYWCPIIGNSIGIHDATWRGSFGGNIYKTNGSHGCINLPLAAVTQLFPILNVGTPVVVFY